MRQAGYLAAACIYGLENNIQRLEEDHHHAKQIATALQEKDFVAKIFPVETNIIIFEVKGRFTPKELRQELQRHGILAIDISKTQIRMLTHLDISEEMVQETIATINEL
jgi:threonine aldolase